MLLPASHDILFDSSFLSSVEIHAKNHGKAKDVSWCVSRCCAVALVRFVSPASSPTRDLCFAVPVPAAVTALGDRDSISSCVCETIITELFRVTQDSMLLAEWPP